jgi:DnaA regulatory inactivator Hda
MSAQLPLEFEYRASQSGDDFIVGNANVEAVQWLDKWPDWHAPFLVIYGESGCGKSHLCEVFKEATGAQDITLQLDPYEAMGKTDVAVIDDVDDLLETSEQELFHLYNFAKENQKTVLLTAHKPCSQWQIKLADLKSRMGAIPVVGIAQPDEQLIEMLFAKLFHDRQLRVDREVLSYLLMRCERSFKAANDLVRAIDRFALAEKRKITIPLVRDVLMQE